MILPLMGLVTALVSKSCTTLSASSFEDVSSVSGSHSLSEAMYLASLSLLRLICSEHNYTPFLLSKNTIDRRLEGARGLRSLTNPAFAQIDNIHYISTMRGLSRVFFVFFLLFLLLSIKWRKLNLSGKIRRRKSFALSDLIISHCGEGTLLRGGRTEMLKRRTSVSSGSRWSSADMINFIIAHLNRPVARSSISLSSGISMFARER